MTVRSCRHSTAFIWAVALLCAGGLVTVAPSLARAAGVVGTGTAASCTDAALDTALAGGGLVTFDCGGPVTIDISSGTGAKTIAEDTTIDGGGLITISGGNRAGVFGIASGGINFTARNLTIANGSSTVGGGIDSDGGSLTVINTAFTGNSAGDDGGGIYCHFCTSLTVINSTFTGNTAGNRGGGIFYDRTEPMTVSNSTFVGNGGPFGSAIFYSNDGPMTVTNSTFSGNPGGPAIASTDGEALLRNTIVAAAGVGEGCHGNIADGGHNLEDGSSCGFSVANGSMTDTNPQLEAAGVTDNGGPTQTIALAPNSPAIGAGDPEVCANPPVNGLDQRGFVRPGIGHMRCSIGAHEADAFPPPEACTGNCNGNGVVAINELILGVNIVLGLQPETACPAFANSEGMVDIAQLVTGVNNALNGCAAPATGPLTVAMPLDGAIAHRGSRFFAAAVTSGVVYSVSIVGLSEAANIAVFSDRAFTVQVCATTSATNRPKECSFTASGDTAFVRVDGQRAAVSEVAYTALLIERPSVVSPAAEGTRDAPAEIAAGVPTAGQVSARGTSFYAVTGLAADQPHFVAITGLTGGADLHVFTDATYSLELDCTLGNNPDVSGAAQDCTVSDTSALFFSVSSGAINRDGAGYAVLVE